jgi:hypothetical protein
MEHIAPIVQALASLAWPFFAFTVLFVLKREITAAIRRITKAEFFGQKVELRAELAELNVSTVASEKEVQELPPPFTLPAEMGQYSGEPAMLPPPNQQESFDAATKSILQQAANDPKLAVMAVSAELEKQARQALAALGLLGDRRLISLSEALNELTKYGFPLHLISTLRLFLDVRNKIVHGVTATNDDALSALDSGLRLLRALSALPYETNIVYLPDVEIFSDSECTQPITDAKGLILESTSPAGSMKMYRIFPTTRRDYYQKGKKVAVDWNMHKKWPEAWWRDPDTGSVKKAWVESAEFIGRHLEEV